MTQFFVNHSDCKTRMTEVEFDVASTKYEMPINVYYYMPEYYERIDQPTEGMVAIYEVLMDAGLRFPLHPTIFHLLVAWRLTPTQITPNSWSYILETMNMFGQAGLYRLPTPMEVNYF